MGRRIHTNLVLVLWFMHVSVGRTLVHACIGGYTYSIMRDHDIGGHDAANGQGTRNISNIFDR